MAKDDWYVEIVRDRTTTYRVTHLPTGGRGVASTRARAKLRARLNTDGGQTVTTRVLQSDGSVTEAVFGPDGPIEISLMQPTGDEMAARGTDAAIARAGLIAQRPEGATGGDQGVDYVQLTAYVAEYGVDMDNQRVDPEWLKRELDAWMERGGLVTIDFRGEPEAECMDLSYDERGAEGTVVALTEKASKAITSGVYAGLGIGIQNAKVDTDQVAPNGRITGGRVIQVSLLDHPMIYRDPPPEPVCHNG